jgi:tripartite-type tricarboxylate transporter receptor subunit TctC
LIPLAPRIDAGHQRSRNILGAKDATYEETSMKKLLTTLAISLAVVAPTLAAPPQEWPNKPVTLLVPFPPGGSTDLIARMVGAKLQEKLGGTFVTENRPGAGGTVGATQAKRAAPDGSTIFVSSLGPFVIGPHLVKDPGYDPIKDFDYITVAVQAPNVLVVNADSPHKSVKEVVDFQKANPEKMTYASAGSGTSDHLTAELFWQETGTKATHVPYKGGAPAIIDLLGGQVDASFSNINTCLTHIQSGKLRPLAVTSPRRSPLLPDVPTMAELGFDGVTVTSWQAFAAPKGLPTDIRDKLRDAVVTSLNDPTIKPKLLELGFEIVGNTPAEFTKFQADEHARWKKVIEVGGITAN